MPEVGDRAGSLAGGIRPLIAGLCGTLDLVFPAGQPSQEAAYPLLHRRAASQAQVPGRLFPRPAPNGFICIEVWAVARQIHQPQPQARRPEVLPHRLATMGWGIIPDSLKRPKVPLAQLVQKGCRGSAVAVARQFQPFHLSCLQTHRRIVAGFLAIPRTAGVHQGWLSPQHPLAPQLRIGTEVGRVGEEYLGSAPYCLLPQGGIRRHEGLPFLRIRLQQPLLGTLEGKSPAAQVGQAATAAPAEAEAFPDKPMHHLPVPVGQVQARLGRQLLHRRPQLLPLRPAKGGGNHRSARISGLWALPHRRPPPIVRWCAGPAPAPPPWPMPSSLGPAARWRTTAPAPGASAPGSSGAARPSSPSATVPETGLSPSLPSSTPPSPKTIAPLYSSTLPQASAFFSLALV